MNPARVLLQLEWWQIRRNRQVLPLFVIFPLVGVILPSLLVFSTGKLLQQVQSGENALLTAMLGMATGLAQVAQIDLEEAARQLLLRSSAAFFVLMPSIILPVTASFAVVGERQRRTLEPLLATPMSDAAFCIGKLVATVVPAVVISWSAAVPGAVLAAVLVHAQHGVWMWPDGIWILGVLLLTPVLAVLVALCCLWVSIRARDPQSATQVSALVMMPVLLLVLGLAGPLMLMSATAIWIATAAVMLLDGVLLRVVLRSFRRTGLLGRD